MAAKDKGRGNLRADFVSKLGEKAIADSEAHHVVPYALARDREVFRILNRAAKAGWNINSSEANGALLPKCHGNGGSYNTDVRNWLLENKARATATTDARTKEVVEECVKFFRGRLPQYFN